MPANRPNLRPPAGGLLLCLVIMLLVVPVSALNSIDEELIEYIDTGVQISAPEASAGLSAQPLKNIAFQNIHNHTNLAYIGIVVPKKSQMSFTLPEGRTECTYTLPGFAAKPAIIHTEYERNLIGTATKMRLVIFFEDWDIGALTGKQRVTFSTPLWTGMLHRDLRSDVSVMNPGTPEGEYFGPYTLTVVSNIVWKNRVQIDELQFGAYDVSLTRDYPDDGGTVNGNSQINLCKDNVIKFFNEDVVDFYTRAMPGEIDEIQLISPSQTYTWPLWGASPSTSTNATATIYVQNSQTGALLADAHIEIQDTTTDPWTEVVNQTLTSGQGTISLAKDPGIHLTQYRIGATVPGYQQVVPALFFRVTGPTNVVVEMEPVEGGPVNEDNAYLEFYVRDLNANGIPNANVLVDGQLRWTNAQGYTQIEVAKNASYPYSVSKSGYVTIEGTATVADGPRYVVNVVLGPGTVPTNPPATSGPGDTPGGPGATPTPDTRTNEQKGQAVIDLLADFAYPIAVICIVATLFGLMQMMTPRRRR